MRTLFVGFIGYSGSGKTTLIERLIERFSSKGYRVGAVKHDAHNFEIDYPGKDSYRMKHAGAKRVVLSSKSKLALVEDRESEMPLEEIKKLFGDCDIVFVEGYKLEDLPKVEVHRSGVGGDYLFKKGIKNIMLVVTDEDVEADVPTLRIDNFEEIALFLERFFKIHGNP